MLPDEVAARLRLEEPRRPLSFFALGEGGPTDASERVDEYVGRAVRRRRGR